MRQTILIIIIIISILTLTAVNAQVDTTNIELPESPELPNAQFAVYQYNPDLQIDILTYQYSNLWDFDNDGIKDSLSFISNGGAHSYYHFQILLSSHKKWIVYPTFQIDMPYFIEKEVFDEMTQFSVYDFDKDGVAEIYLNIDNPFGTIPAKLKRNGLTSKRMLIEFENNELIVKNFEKKIK